MDALSQSVGRQLARQFIAMSFKAQTDMKRELASCIEKLNELGPGLATLALMRSALLDWCEQSARLTQTAIQGDYINPPGKDFFLTQDDQTHSRNLRSLVARKNRDFATKIAKWGSACLIVDDERIQTEGSQVKAKARYQYRSILEAIMLRKLYIHS